jgi:ribose transport system ATP-binding protein
LIRQLQADGVAILYVSHRLPEILRICNRIVVLRDGVKVGEYAPSDLDESSLANLMVGRELKDVFPTKQTSGNEIVLEVPSWGLRLRRGEILGLGGLIGSGRTEFAEAICGLAGEVMEIVIDGTPTRFTDYSQAIQGGVMYVSEDRKGKGLVTSMSVSDNIVLADLLNLASRRAKQSASADWIQKLRIKVPDPDLPMTSLSGGNQQKCSIAKWLQKKPKVLFLDEPTRGVDVGAKAEIYQLICELAEQGLACVVISSELPELIGLSHRVCVFRDGRIVGELDSETMNERSIMSLAAGVAVA